MNEAWSTAIDWDRPWLVPLRATACELLSIQDWRSRADRIAAQRALVNHRGLPIAFADQAELPTAEAYESFISRTGRVPTRDNLHDFFNALVWLTYPLAKARLNAAQAEEIARSSMAATAMPSLPRSTWHEPGRSNTGTNARGKVRDRATVFDENAAVLVTSETSVEAALQQHDWHGALVAQQAAFGSCCEIRLFGHALMEKLIAPYKAITGHVWVVRVAPGYFGMEERGRRREADLRLSEALAAGSLDAPGMPLPILGVPGWWHGQDAAFYEDRNVFRPKRGA